MQDLTTLLRGRTFKIWEYRVSHSSLLVRSPATGSHTTNIDLVFKGVVYLEGPTNLGEISIECLEPTQFKPAAELGGAREPRVWKLYNDRIHLFIVAAFLDFEENDLEIFDSPFDFNRRDSG